MLSHVLSLIAAVGVFCLLFTVGNFLRGRLLDRGADVFFIPFDVALGAVAVSLVMFALSLLRLYRPATGIVFDVLCAASAFNPALRRHVQALFRDMRAASRHRLALGTVTACFLSCAGFATLAPPTAKDALVYHLEVQKTYLAHGGFVELPRNVYSYLPQGVESLYTLGMLMVGDRVPALIHFGFALVFLLAVFNLARRLEFSEAASELTVLMLASTPILWMEATWPYVDLGVGLFVATATTALFERFRAGHPRWLILAGLLLGAAVAAKLNALIFVVLLAVVFLMAARFGFGDSAPLDDKAVLRDAARLLVPVGIVTAPWLLKNVVLTGNPLFPFLFDLFPTKSAGWDGFRSSAFHGFLKTYGSATKDFLDSVLLPAKVCLFARHDEIHRYDGEIGAFYLLFVPAATAWKVQSRPLRYLTVLTVGYWVFWMSSSQQARFLIPILPFAAVVVVGSAVALLERIPETLRPTARTAAVGLCLAVCAWNAVKIADYVRERHIVGLVTGRERLADVLAERLAETPFFEYLNTQTPPSIKVFLVGTGNRTYYLNREFVADYVFEDYTFIEFAQASTTADELAGRIRGLGATHVLIRPDLVLAPEFIRFDEAARRRTIEFLTRTCKTVKRSDRLLLLELPLPSG